jgi:nitroimidazol reductase NimA-like FMN-containing flavoprotein (pyridoxamine 5'-phosphate oxidase superfamily)
MHLQGPWSAEEIGAFLQASVIPLRLGVVRPEGTPLVLSLWFVPQDGALCCATSRDAYVAKLLRREPRCAFEVAADNPPYKGVRGQGRASLHDEQGAEILDRLLDRYAISPTSKLGRMLLARAENETAIQILPHRMTSWDFTARMSA